MGTPYPLFDYIEIFMQIQARHSHGEKIEAFNQPQKVANASISSDDPIAGY